MNRELDEKVARAMGWDIVLSDIQAPWQEKPERHHPLRAYSTDPATIPEMLAWLRASKRHVLLLVAADDGITTASCYRGPLDASVPIQSGTTLNEALARLVVSLAEAKP